MTCFQWAFWLVRAPRVLNQYKNVPWIAVDEHLETFLNIGILALVNVSFYAGSLLIYSVSNLQKQKQKKKATLFFCFINFSHFPGSYNFAFFLSGYTQSSWGPSLQYYLRLSLFMLVSHHHCHWPLPLLHHHYCFQRLSVLLGFYCANFV